MLAASAACQNYFVTKVIRSKKFETEYQKMSTFEFNNFVLNLPISNFDEKFKENSVAAIRKRYQLGEKPLLFSGKDVAVREWLNDILGYYQVDTLYVWLQLELGVPYAKLRDLKIGDTLIPRARLISLVEVLEYVTGRKLLVETFMPMAFLGENFSLHEVMKFFAYGTDCEHCEVADALKRWKEVEDAYRAVVNVDASVESSELLGMKIPVKCKKDILILANRLKERLNISFPTLHQLLCKQTRVGDLLHVVYAAKFFGYQAQKITLGQLDRQSILAMYREEVEVASEVSDEELLAMPLKSVLPPYGSAADWDLPIHWLEARLDIQFPDLYEAVNDETIVLDIVDWIYEACN